MQDISLHSSAMFGWSLLVRGWPSHGREIATGVQHYPWALAAPCSSSAPLACANVEHSNL